MILQRSRHIALFGINSSLSALINQIFSKFATNFPKDFSYNNYFNSANLRHATNRNDTIITKVFSQLRKDNILFNDIHNIMNKKNSFSSKNDYKI